MPGVVLVATIGFSADLIMRRVRDRGSGISYLICIGLDAGDNQFQRVESTYNLINFFLRSEGVESHLERVHVRQNLIREIRTILAQALSRAGEDGTVELLLSGGPRILVVSALLAAMTMRREDASRIRVIVYGEGFPAFLEVGLRAVIELLSLEEVDWEILRLLAEGKTETRALLEYSKLPRSTLFKRLRLLRNRGLIRQDRRGLWVLDDDVRKLL